MRTWSEIWEGLQNFFTGFSSNWVEYLLQFLLIAVIFYFVFKILKTNKAEKFIAVVVAVVVFTGAIFALSSKFSQDILLLVIIMVALLIFTMFITDF